MNLELSQTALLTGINNRIEFHGEDKVPAVDLEFKIEVIAAGELDQLAIDGEMYSTNLWTTSPDKDLVGGFELGGPRMCLLKPPFTIDVKIENHKAEVNVEGAENMPKKQVKPIHIEPATVKKVKFTPLANGQAELTFQISGSLNGHETGIIIDKYLGCKVSFMIQPSTGAQDSLLDGDGDKAAPLASV